MGGTTVDPGDLDDFAKRMRELDEDWTDENGYPQRVLLAEDGDSGFPRLGTFEEAGQFRTQYNAARANMAQNFNDLHNLLEGLADASKKIADQYRSTEALNNASVGEIDRILGEEMAPAPGSGQPGQTGQPNPQAQA
ncbi:hypothetical protein ABN028_16790 [Actinopolymorpha sp. B17G11]|uniref:hypothetical protein n=1 Tax=unclassified Actinopolymorpha TaxID=2627063 RepID=UPI0032D97507